MNLEGDHLVPEKLSVLKFLKNISKYKIQKAFFIAKIL